MKAFSFGLCLALVAIGAGGVPAAAPAQTPGQRPETFVPGERFFPALNRVLTGAQRNSLRAALETQQEKIRSLEEKARVSRRALLGAAVGGKFDEAAARRNAQAAAQAEAELTVTFARALAEIKPPLSAQQIEQLKNFQPGRPRAGMGAEPPAAPEKHLPLPPPLPRDTNDLPVVK